jgi:hypothetical protein
MFTRCQACHTVHPLNAALLAQGGGKYRCGKCHKKGDALLALFDNWPDASQQGVNPGDIPELGSAIKIDQTDEAHSESEDEEGEPFLLAGSSRAGRSRFVQRVVWITGALLLAVVITFSLITFFQPAALGQSRTDSALSAVGLESKGTSAPFRDVDQIELLSRELMTHPTESGKLQLKLTLVNRAGQGQPYPDIDVILLDLQNQRLARHVFKPVDYLTRSAQFRNGMTPEAFLTIDLEIPDPGERAVGFELQFH